MKREDLKAFSLSDEDIQKIMDIHGADVEKQKRTIETLKTERETMQKSLDEVQKKLEGFQKINVDDLQAQVTDLQSKLEQERADRAREESKRAIQGSVSEFLKNKRFVNEITKNSIVNSLSEALEQDSAKGKSIEELFHSLVSDEQGNMKENILIDEEKRQLEQNRAQFTTKIRRQSGSGLSVDDVKQMTPEEINKNWDKVQEALKGGK